MKIYVAIAIILLSTTFTSAQIDSVRSSSPTIRISNEYGEQCGSYVEESQLYFERTGKVTEVLNANTLLFKQKSYGGNREKGNFTVTLAGIETAGNDANIKDFLVKKLLNKHVAILGNTKEDADTSFFGVISITDSEGDKILEINRHLIENGLAKFTEPGYFYSVSYVTMCIYGQLEEKAKKENLGIWAK